MLAHGITQGGVSELSGGRFTQGFFSAALSAGLAGAITKEDGTLKVRPGIAVVASAVVGGTASVLSGGKFANGAITGAYVMLFNQMMHHPKPLRNLKEYVDEYFPGRLPKDVPIEWKYWSGEGGKTVDNNIADKTSPLTVYIQKSYGEGDPCGLLYDSVGHELDHIDDYTSGRAYKWYNQYGQSLDYMIAIMDYRAFSRNQEYSNMYRNGQYDYSGNIKNLKLPKGYLK
jgi:hypothetical protein